MSNDASIAQQLADIREQLRVLHELLEHRLPKPRHARAEITLDVKEKAKTLFAEGRSVRQVAQELKIGQTSAHRLREAFAAALATGKGRK